MDSSRCLDDDTVAAFVAGELAPSERERIERHIDACAACRRLIAALARFSSRGTGASSSDNDGTGPAQRLERGAVLGRFVVLDHVGSGGMGTVYAAYDPELDRKVALKLLHRPGSAGEKSPLILEAQAMARVAHPNVVAVHDVGTVGDRIFIAMEFVEGVTLRQWLRAESRTRPAIVSAFLEAGRGLAAAHAAGLVHRDFKPDNVLMGKDGRARVTDFGLAHDASASTGGVVAGTPAYMSPEQSEGKEADARSDQYSFCVALHQALHGELPGRSPPSGPLRRLLLRGLSPDPARRFPSMAALLEELGRAPQRAKARWLGAGGALMAALLVVGFGLRARAARAAMCAGGEERLGGVWDAPKKDAAARQFSASGKPFSQDAWSAVTRTLDAYAGHWVDARRASCEATRLRGEQSEDTYALRTACLDRRLDEMRALTDLFASADATVVEHAAAAARKLTPVAACEPGAALTMQPIYPSDPGVRAAVEKLRLELNEARALLDSGKYAQGLAVADRGVLQAQKLAYPPIAAEAFYLQGSLREEMFDSKGAEESLYQAAIAAETARHDRVAAESWALLVSVVGYKQARHEAGHVLAQPARAAILRAGEAPDLAAPLENNLGTLAWVEGKYAEAHGHFEKAASLWETALGPEHPFVADALNNQGLVLWNEGRYELALAAHQRALGVRQKLLGAEHPVVASSLNNLGIVHYSLGRFVEAAEHHLRAVTIQERTLGADHPLMANSLNNYGLALLAQGRPNEALAAISRAYSVRRKSRPAEHPDIANSKINLAMVYDALHRESEALSNIEEGHALQLRLLGPEHPDLAETETIFATILLHAKRTESALAHAERAVALAQKNFTAGHPVLSGALDVKKMCATSIRGVSSPP